MLRRREARDRLGLGERGSACRVGQVWGGAGWGFPAPGCPARVGHWQLVLTALQALPGASGTSGRWLPSPAVLCILSSARPCEGNQAWNPCPALEDLQRARGTGDSGAQETVGTVDIVAQVMVGIHLGIQSLGQRCTAG